MLPLAARCAVYVEPRASILHLSGTPEVGVLVSKVSFDTPSTAAGLGLGWEISPTVRIEFRYTDIGTVKADVLSTQILPPLTGTQLVALHEYEFSQRSRLWSVALPIRVWARDRLMLHFTPLIHCENTKTNLVRIDPQFGIPENPPPPVIRTVANRSNSTALHPGAELSLAYGVAEHFSLTAYYTYAPLKNLDAHLFGLGLGLSF
ncbi:MAG: hypothetical protein HYV95_00530 [Opitutae bacterium]|nr:hypothetical protein [Opitutae bacterium]